MDHELLILGIYRESSSSLKIFVKIETKKSLERRFYYQSGVHG